MGPDPGTRRQILAQGPTAARSASPRGTGVTPNHHTAMLQNRLPAGRRPGLTAVFRSKGVSAGAVRSGVQAATKATREIRIVIADARDPFGTGLVASLPRPS